MELLAVKPGGFYVDGTVGMGGHTAEMLRRSAPHGRVLGLDRDSESLERAAAGLQAFSDRLRLEQADFRGVPSLLEGARPDGILLDLGISSAQLDDPDRGFSFMADGPLDMRMDRSGGETAAEVVNRLPEKPLADLIYRFGEEPASRSIARAVVAARRRARIRTTGELAAIVRGAAGRSRRPGLDPATRTFQALRIHVNRELESLGRSILELAQCLAEGGRLVVIAFHSLEDREVKHAFRDVAKEGFRVLTRKPVRPGEAEVRANPRARSARLRAVARESVALAGRPA